MDESQRNGIEFHSFPAAALERVGATGAEAMVYDQEERGEERGEEETPSASARRLTSFPPFAVVSSEMATTSEGVYVGRGW